jgi:hypothetical protein
MYLIKLKTKAAMLLSDLTGKTFTVGQVTATGNGANKWLVLQPKGAAAAAKAKGTVMLKVTGNKQLIGLAGKTVTVGKAPVMGVGGVGKWLALHPVAAAAKGAAVKGAVAGGGGATVILTAAPANSGAMAGKAAMAGKSAMAGKAAATAVAAKSASAGTIWAGTGMSLGLGLGLGALGPALLAGAATAGGYYLYKKKKESISDEGISDELEEAIA